MNQSLLHLDTKAKEQGMRLSELELELVASRGELECLSPQLATARVVRDWAFGYGYRAGVAHLQSHQLAHPRIDLT